MATDHSYAVCARFDRFQFDPATGELRNGGVRVTIQEQPLQILRLLLRANGGIVTREQIRLALWPEDVFVDFEHGVNTAIKKLRLALEDSAEHPRFVETLPRVGYRFIVPVEWVDRENREGQEHRKGEPLFNVVSIASPPADPVGPSLTLMTEPGRRTNLKGSRLTGRLKVSLAIIAAGVAVAVGTTGFLLRDPESYVSRTRLGGLLRATAAGRTARPGPALSQRRLTANPEDVPVSGAILSPDGKFLAFSDSTGLYIRQVNDGETHAVPLADGFDAHPESWFPDSAHLVVSHFEDKANRPPSLWTISMMGGTPRKLAEGGLSARVSPDGSQVAYLKGMWDNEEIWLVKADGNGARKFVDGGQDMFTPVAWSPDGKRFACARGFTSYPLDRFEKHIEIYDVASGTSQTILSGSGLGDEIAWLASGRLIYSLREVDPTQDDYNLWWVQLDAHTLKPASQPARITNDRGHTARITIDDGGTRLALLRGGSQSDVYLSDVEQHGNRLSKPRRLTLDDRADYASDWTPDSKAVLFQSDRDGRFHLFRQPIDQTQPELMVGGNQDIGPPQLSPEGQNVLYSVPWEATKPSDHIRIMQVPLAGGPSQLVLEEPGITAYQCARHPVAFCVYSRIENGMETFFTFTLAGGKGKEIVVARRKCEGGPGCNWALSPNGRYLAYPDSPGPYEGTASDVRVLDLASGAERKVSLSGMDLIMGLNWSSNGQAVLVGGYMGRNAGGTRSGLMTVDLHGKVTTLLAGPYPTILWAIPSRDGRRVAIAASTQSSNVWLLENF